MEERKPRWKERLITFNKAMNRLQQVVDMQKERTLNEYEEDSMIKRFEFTYEMAWKLMMSYEKDNGVQQLMGSRDVVRQAVTLSLIANGDAWMDMIDARNTTSHVYDEAMADNMIDSIVHSFFPLLCELKIRMEQLSQQ